MPMSILAQASAPSGTAEYTAFLAVLGALGRLVILSMCLERGLAFIFEHEWFVMVFTKKGMKPSDPDSSNFPGVKGLIAFAAAAGICLGYNFDVIAIIFNSANSDKLGMLMTALVAAGGSAGAISLFQGFLNISKESRDALIAAKKAESESAKQKAESDAAISKINADRVKAEAEAATAIAKANQQRTEVEAAASMAAARAKQAESEAAIAAAKARQAEAERVEAAARAGQ